MFWKSFFKNNSSGFALNISDHSIEAVSVKESGEETYSVAAWGRFVIPEGIVHNGRVEKKEKLAESIKKLLAKPSFGVFEGKNVVLSVPEEHTYTIEMVFSSLLDHEEIKELIPHEISKSVPYEYNELYWDFQVVDKGEKDSVISVSACPKVVVDDLLDVLKILKLSAVVVTLESLGAVHGLKQTVLLDPVLVLDMGAYYSLSFIYDKHAIRKNYSLPLGGNLLSEKISSELHLKFDEAEQEKRTKGLSKGASDQLAEILKEEGANLVREVKRILDDYNKEYNVKVEKIVITGGGSLVPGLSEFISTSLGLKSVEGALQGLKKSPQKNWEQLFLVAYGLARRSTMPAFGKNNGFDFLRYMDELNSADV